MLLALTAGLALSVPKVPISSPKLANEFITEADLPKGWVKRSDGSGGTVFLTYLRVSVASTGQPVHCEIATTHGLPKNFDACALALGRAKFHPATDEAGEPIFGTTYVWFFWKDKKWLGSKYDYLFPPDLDLFVNRMPRPAPFGINIKFDVLGDVNGHIEACSPQPGIDANTLGRIACAEIMKKIIVPAKNADNMPVRAVQSYVATFSQSNSRKTR